MIRLESVPRADRIPPATSAEEVVKVDQAVSSPVDKTAVVTSVLDTATAILSQVVQA
jgi:hypothetical protein